MIVLDLIDIWVPLLDLAFLILEIDPIEESLHYHNRDPMIRILDSVLELLLPGVLFNHSVSFVDRGLVIIIFKKKGVLFKALFYDGIQLSGSNLFSKGV